METFFSSRNVFLYVTKYIPLCNLLIKKFFLLYVNLYRAVYYVLEKHFLYIISHRAFANVFYVIFIPEGRAEAAVGGQFASSLKILGI